MGASFRALGFLLRGTTVLWEFGGVDLVFLWKHVILGLTLAFPYIFY